MLKHNRGLEKLICTLQNYVFWRLLAYFNAVSILWKRHLDKCKFICSLYYIFLGGNNDGIYWLQCSSGYHVADFESETELFELNTELFESPWTVHAHMHTQSLLYMIFLYKVLCNRWHFKCNNLFIVKNFFLEIVVIRTSGIVTG